MILIITSKTDGHISSVTKHLDSKKVKWHRINTEDFANNIRLTLSPDNLDKPFNIFDSGRTFKLDKIKSVWYRKPDPVSVSDFLMPKDELDYVEGEFTEILNGIYATLNHCKWINNPFVTKLAHRKILQLKVAKNLGFKIPNTIISNNPSKVFSFAKVNNWDIAIKSLGAISVISNADTEQKQYGLFTRRINKSELYAVKSKIKFMPTMFQEYIPKKFELRITCVGNKIFGCKIDSQSNESSKEDMRFNIQDLKHSPYDCAYLEKKLLDYLKFFNLNFGCFDIAVNHNNEFVFFECNPNGQWLWIENMTGMKIGEEISKLLMSP